jgi:hypothetical protein
MKFQMPSIKLGRMPFKVMTTLSMLTLMQLVSGCRTAVVPISPERRVETLKAGVPYTPKVNGKFVPDAQYLDMQDAYIRESFRK